MTPQRGDHFAHPVGDPDVTDAAVIAYNRRLVAAMFGEDIAASIFTTGIPSRDHRDEDRAQEARRGARAMREIEFRILATDARNDAILAGSWVRSPLAREYVRDVERFVPQPAHRILARIGLSKAWSPR